MTEDFYNRLFEVVAEKEINKILPTLTLFLEEAISLINQNFKGSNTFTLDLSNLYKKYRGNLNFLEEINSPERQEYSIKKLIMLNLKEIGADSGVLVTGENFPIIEVSILKDSN